MSIALVFAAGGLEKWLTRNTSFTSEQSRIFVNRLAEAGLEDEIVAIVESAFEAGFEAANQEQP